MLKAYEYHPLIKNNNKGLKIVKKTISPAFELGMDKRLYGMTMYFTLMILKHFQKAIINYLSLHEP